MAKPTPATFPVYFQQYIDQVPETDLSPGFANQLPVIKQYLNGITEDQSKFAYAEGKWTMKEVLQHIIDTERIFCYRALCFARNETVSLPGFDENNYAANAFANNRTWQSLTEEWLAVRHATTALFESFSEAALNAGGISNNLPNTALACGFIILGHCYHHKKVMEERYL